MKITDSLESIKRRQFIAEMGDRFIIPPPKDDKEEKSDVKWCDGKAQELAVRMAKTKLNRSNVRGLETLAWSTDNVGSLLDYLRIRVGRNVTIRKGKIEKKEWAQDDVGIDLANYLEKLYNSASDFLEDMAESDKHRVQQLHLELCREFVKHLVAYFEFENRGS